MSTFEDLVAKAKAQTHALRTTLNELSTAPIEAPAHDVPEIQTALARLHTIRNGYRLTEVVDPSMKDFMDGKIEGIEIAIESLEGRGAKRGRRREPVPASELIRDPKTPPKHVLDVPAVAKTTAPKPRPFDLELGKGKLAVLAAIGEGADRWASIPLIGLLTTYKRRSIENYVGMLKSDGLIEQHANQFRTTGRGVRELERIGFVRTLPIELLSKGERLVIDAIVRGKKHGVTKPMLTLDTPYKRRSVDNYVTTLGTRELVEERERRIHLTKYGETVTADLEVGPLKLTEGEDVLFEAITMAKDGVSKNHLCAILEGQYKRRSIENYLSTLITRELVTVQDGVYKRRKD